MTIRKYSSRSQQTTLTGAITSGATSMTVVSGTALLGGVTIPSGTTFTLVIDVDTALEEIVDATAVSTNTFTITRAIDGSSAQDHSAGAVVRHMAIGRDYRDANTHTEADSSYNDGSGNAHTMHGIAAGEGVVVGTLKTQTLTNKTLTSPTITDPTISGTVGGASITFEGSTADAYETTLAVTDPTADRTITLPDATGNVVLDTLTQTLTNKTLTSPTISGSPVITGLSSAGMVASSATPKDYVDSILGSATSAATSAASAAASATAAATSATSAAASATAAATSATSASASASAASTSASSALADATFASTSATSSATSANAAASSATAAATSATSAAASATAAATSATSAAASATAAATSATSAAASATSAAASFDQFDDIYLGAKSSPPSVDNDGNALQTGALYWNTSTTKMYVWSGTAWGEISSSADIIAYKYTTQASQTSVSGADDNGLTLSYVVGKEQVYINGVLQVRGSDYTATTGSSITGMTALAANDIVTVLAFTAFSVANTIGISTLSAKGNILTASASSTPAVIAVGSNDQVLVADSSTSTGLAWKSYSVQGQAAGKNAVINGGFDIWQRGTSLAITSSSTSFYGPDRWQIYRGATGSTVSRQATGDTTNLPNIQYAMRIQRDSGNTSTVEIVPAQNFETVNSIPFAGRTVTLSFYARRGANYSATNNILLVGLNTGTGTDQNIQVGFTQSTSVISQNATLTTTWQRFSYTANIGATATQIAPYFQFTPTGTAGANDYFEITGVQLEIGSTATPFSRAGGTIQGELAACQRYYNRLVIGTAYGWFPGIVSQKTTTAFNLTYDLPVQMRVAPTSIEYGGSFRLNAPDDTGIGVTSFTWLSVTTTRTGTASGVSSTATANTFYRLQANNDANAYIGWNAEL